MDGQKNIQHRMMVFLVSPFRRHIFGTDYDDYGLHINISYPKVSEKLLRLSRYVSDEL